MGERPRKAVPINEASHAAPTTSSPPRARGDHSVESNEARFRTAIEQCIPLGLAAVDMEGRQVYVNPSFCEMTGWSEEELIGESPPFRYWPEDEIENIQRAFRATAEGRAPEEGFHLFFRHSSGDKIAVLVTVAPLVESGRDQIGWLASVLDISERARVEERLRRKEERLQLILEAAKVGTWDWDVQTGKVAWSGNMEDVHGLAAGTFSDSFESVLEDIHPADRAHMLEAVTGAMETGEPFHVEYRLAERERSNNARWVEGQGRVIYGKDGRPERMVGVCKDVTLRRVEAEKFRVAVEASPSGVIMMDSSGRISLVNSHTEKMFGYERDELIGRTIEVLIPERFRAKHQHHRSNFFERMQRRPMGVGIDLFGLRKDGTEFPVEIGLNPIEMEDGLFVLSVVTDISERKRAEDKLREQAHRLEEADRHKNFFLAMLGHELRNPLVPIQNAVEVLKIQNDGGIPNPTLGWGTGLIERQLKQLTRLVDDLMDVSRIASGKLTLNCDYLDARELLINAIEAVQPFVEARRHELKLSIPPQYVPLLGDSARLAQIFINLVNNAAKYTEEGGTIVVEMKCSEEEMSVSVRDTGIGIPADSLGHIFDLFRQAEQAAQRSPGGLGLGLTLVRQLTEMHGGTVEAFSAGEGQGSEFVVHLPTVNGCFG